MTAMIEVKRTSEGEFRVVIQEGGSETSHLVSLADDYCRKLTGGKSEAEELVRKSFEFLLEREPKESILRKFSLPVIGHYFPEYEREMKKRLRGWKAAENEDR
jgi:hypothetical protein